MTRGWYLSFPALLLSACALWPVPPSLWAPERWPLTTYEVVWPASKGPSLRLWVAIEADAEGLGLVVLSPEGLTLLTARYAGGQLTEQRRLPGSDRRLNARELLEGWQLAYGPDLAVAGHYGADCHFKASAQTVKTLYCGVDQRGRVEMDGGVYRVQRGNTPAQLWRTLSSPAAPMDQVWLQ